MDFVVYFMIRVSVFLAALGKSVKLGLHEIVFASMPVFTIRLVTILCG